MNACNAVGEAADPGSLSVTGTYVRGRPNYEFTTLELTTEGVFEWRYSSHVGGWSSAGTYTGDSCQIRFEESARSPAEKKSLLPDSLEIVTWGARLYLIAPDEGVEFANAVNRGAEPRTTRLGRFLLREGDWSDAVDGPPIGGGDWRRFLLSSPLVGKVIERDADGQAWWVDLGQADGVKEGLELWFTGVVAKPDARVNKKQTSFEIPVVVSDVEAHRSRVRFKYPQWDVENYIWQAGQCITSRPTQPMP